MISIREVNYVMRALIRRLVVVCWTPFGVTRLKMTSGSLPLWYRSTVALLVIPRLRVRITERARWLHPAVVGAACGLVLQMLLILSPFTSIIR